MEETPQGSVSPVTDEQARASASDAALSKAARDLAATLVQNNANPDSVQILKATVAAVDAGTTTIAPTVSIYLQGDTTAAIPGVAYYDSYSPVVGDTVQVLKVGNQVAILGQLNDTGSGTVNGWTAVPLGTGVTTFASDPARYRLVYDNGEKKIQLRGGVVLSGTQTVLFTLPAGFRPVNNIAPVLVAQNEVTNGSQIACSVVMESSGICRLYHGGFGIDTSNGGVGGGSAVTSTSGTGQTSFSGVQHYHVGNFDGNNTSGMIANDPNPHSHAGPSHSHVGGNHQHPYIKQAYPDEIYFTGIEYFI